MRNIGIIAIILVLISLIAFLTYKYLNQKKEEKKAVEKAATLANAEAIHTVGNFYTFGLFDTQNVRQFGK